MSDRTMLLLGMLLMVLALPGALPAASGPVVVDRVIAVVNDEIITMSDLQREQARRTDVRDPKLLLEDMIDRKLQMSMAKRNNLDVMDREVADAIADIKKRNNLSDQQFEEALAREGLTPDQYRIDLREQMTLSRLFNKYIRSGITVDEKEIRAHYDKNPGQFSLPEEVRVRQLVVALQTTDSADQRERARQQAQDLMARLFKGEDFIKLIREHSGSASAAQDGDLGFLQRGHAIAEIEEASKNLKPGEFAGPILCQDGFHIIRVEAIRTPLIPFEKVKDDISKVLFEQKTEVAYRTWLQTIRSDAHIENRL